MKIRRKSAIGLGTLAAFASACGPGSAGAPPAVAAVGFGVAVAEPLSLRMNARAVHNNGSAPGEPELPRAPNQDARLPLSPDTDPRGWADFIIGTAGTAATAPVATCDVVRGTTASPGSRATAVPLLNAADIDLSGSIASAEGSRCGVAGCSGDGGTAALDGGEVAARAGEVLSRVPLSRVPW